MKKDKFKFQSSISLPPGSFKGRSPRLQGRKNSDSDSPKDYGKIKLSGRQIGLYYCGAFMLLFFIGILFYRSLLAGIIACLAAFPLQKVYSSILLQKQKERLLDDFRDALYSMSSSLAAGKQMPAAIELSAKAAEKSKGRESVIASEFFAISRNYEKNHADMGAMLEDFAQRSGIEEIKQFSASFRTCQFCGGNTEEVCLKSASLILDRIAVARKTRALVAQKKPDIILLSAMPAAVLLVLNIVGYSYVAVLYESFAGRVVMSLCLFLMTLALIWGLKILRIEL